MTGFQTVIIHSVEEVTLSLNCQARLNGLRKNWSQKEEAILHLLRIKNKFLD